MGVGPGGAKLGQPAAENTSAPLLSACTAPTFTSTYAVEFWYSLPISGANVTVVKSGTVVSPGARARL